MQALQQVANASTLLAALRSCGPATLPHLTHLLPHPVLLTSPTVPFSTSSSPTPPSSSPTPTSTASPHAPSSPAPTLCRTPTTALHPTTTLHHPTPTPAHPPTTRAASSLTAKLQQEELWLNGVDSHVARWASIGTYPALKDRNKEVTALVRERYLALLTTHAAGRILDEPARRHLKMVCLAVATMQELEGEAVGVRRQDAEELVAMSLGSLLSPFFSAAMKGSVWVKARVLGRDPWELAVGTLKDVGVDMAGACKCDVKGGAGGEAGAVMEVAECLYQEVLVAEGAQHLLQYFCCGFNMTWFGVYGGYGVRAAKTACLADGDACCRIELEKQG